RRKHVLDLMHEHALAGRPALMHAQILVRIELAAPAKHADLDVAVKHDAAAAVLEGRGLAHGHFCHAGIRSQAPIVVLRSKLAYAPCSSVTGGCDKSRALSEEHEETPFFSHRT